MPIERRHLGKRYGPYRFHVGLEQVKDFVAKVAKQVTDSGAELRIMGVGTTGYAKDILKDAIGADVALVETVAHTQSALHFYPDADVICDVGGQDIKIMVLKDGSVKPRTFDFAFEEIPVLIDEAYHHFADNPDYATSVPHVIEGRPVIVTRTFSKIAALAGMRLGYAVATEPLIDRMRPYTGRMTINAIVKWGGVAALKDTTASDRVRNETIRLRKKMAADLSGLGYSVIPSDGNFFMVNLRRSAMPVIQAFRQRGILVGRPFPPMLEYLRVSLGTAEDMDRFLAAFNLGHC